MRSNKYLSAIRRVFVDAHHINSAKLEPGDMCQLDADLDYFGDLVITMPAHLAEKVESHAFFRYNYRPINVLVYSDRYLEDLDVTKKELYNFIIDSRLISL